MVIAISTVLSYVSYSCCSFLPVPGTMKKQIKVLRIRNVQAILAISVFQFEKKLYHSICHFSSESFSFCIFGHRNTGHWFSIGLFLWH